MTRGDAVVAALALGPTLAGGRRVLEAAHHLLAVAGVGLDQLDRIVVGVGPGGFTGLRIGIATALALGQALAVDVEGASSLEALALGIGRAVPAGALVAPVIDARRREVFAALYRVDGDALDTVMEPAAVPAAEIADRIAESAGGVAVTAAGDGVPAVADLLSAAGVTVLPAGHPAHHVSAVELVRRADAGAALPAAPRYLRLPDAEVNRLRAEAAGQRSAA